MQGGSASSCPVNSPALVPPPTNAGIFNPSRLLDILADFDKLLTLLNLSVGYLCLDAWLCERVVVEKKGGGL